MADAVIIDAVRTPLGKGKATGALAGTHPVDLLAHPLRAVVERTGVDPETIDDVIVGAVSQVGDAVAADVQVDRHLRQRHVDDEQVEAGEHHARADDGEDQPRLT